MKKRVSIVIFALIVVLTIIVCFMAHHYYGLTDERPTFSCQQHQDDTLRLAIIGDSWAFYHYKHDASLAQKLSDKTHHPVKINSYGLCGATSKEVYNCLFEDKALHQLLQDGADYCFLSVGINDTYKKIGADYYAHHTILILRFLLQNNITPILLEIPDYDINYAYEHQTADRKFLRHLSMFFTNSSLDCREDYRQALRKRIDEARISHQVILIPNQQWDMCLYRSDRMHLNDKGYEALDSCLTSIININTTN